MLTSWTANRQKTGIATCEAIKLAVQAILLVIYDVNDCDGDAAVIYNN